MATRAQKRTNIVVSRVVPPVLLGVVTYASYAITKPLCSETPMSLMSLMGLVSLDNSRSY